MNSGSGRIALLANSESKASSISMIAGSQIATGSAGSIVMAAGRGFDSVGGEVELRSGSGNAGSGAVTVGTSNSQHFSSGAVAIHSGSSDDSLAGEISIAAGMSGGLVGADVTLHAGDSSANAGKGGSIQLLGGDGDSTTGGQITVNSEQYMRPCECYMRPCECTIQDVHARSRKREQSAKDCTCSSTRGANANLPIRKHRPPVEPVLLQCHEVFGCRAVRLRVRGRNKRLTTNCGPARAAPRVAEEGHAGWLICVKPAQHRDGTALLPCVHRRLQNARAPHRIHAPGTAVGSRKCCRS